MRRDGDEKRSNVRANADSDLVGIPGKQANTDSLGGNSTATTRSSGTPGKRTNTEGLAETSASEAGAALDAGGIPRAVIETIECDHGEPLGEHDRWSRRLGKDVAHARIVKGERAARAAAMIGARAFTVGHRVFFGAGKDERTDGGELLGHELTHVVQQTNAATKPADQLDIVPRTDAREVAARGHDASGPDSEQAIARDAEPDIDGPTYRKQFAKEIGDEIVKFLDAHDVAMPSKYVTYPGPLFIGPAILGVSGEALTAKLDTWLGAAKVTELVNKGRPKGRKVDGNTATDTPGDGPARWFPGVGVEIASALHALLAKSLERIVPRFISAAVAVGTELEQKAGASQKNITPKPTEADIIPSHPIDTNVIHVLVSTANLDFTAYRKAFPNEKGKKGELRTVTVKWEPARNKTFWVRVVSPQDATPEEVAKALFGSPTYTSELAVVAHPLYGLDRASNLLEAHKASLMAMGIDANQSGDATKTALDMSTSSSKDSFAEELAKNQAKNLPHTAMAKGDVIRSLDQTATILTSIETSAASFGTGKEAPSAAIEPLRKKLSERRAKLGSASDQDALGWAGHVEAQQSVLTQISFSFAKLAKKLASLKGAPDAAGKHRELPPYVDAAMASVAKGYAACVAMSELPQTVAAKLAEVEEQASALPIAFLEGALEAIQRTIDERRGAKEQGKNVEELRAREEKLRVRIAAVRAKAKTNPEAAQKDLQELGKLVNDLETETTCVANMDQIDIAWNAVKNAYRSDPNDRRKRRLELRDEGDRWHARWKHIYNDYKAANGDEAKQKMVKQQLDELRKDGGLKAWFDNCAFFVQEQQAKQQLETLAVLLAITVVTAGIGDIVAAGAMGWELGAGATTVVASGAEALVFTTLNQLLLDPNHKLGHIAYELGTNWAMFGAMRRFAMFAEVAELSQFKSVTGSVVIMAATTYAKEDLDKLVMEGRHLNNEEIKQIAINGLMMAIAMHGVAPKLKPFFEELEGSAYAFTTKLKANNETQRALKASNEALVKSKDLEAANDYVAKEKAWLEQRLKILDEIEAQAKKEAEPGKKPKDGGIASKIKMSAKQLAELRSDLQGNLKKLNDQTDLVQNLEPKAPGLYTCPREKIEAVTKALGKVQNVAVDPETGVRTFTVEQEGGGTIRVMEVVKATAEEIAKAYGITDPKAIKAIDTAAKTNEAGLRAFLDTAKPQPGLANRLLAEFGDKAPLHFKAEGGVFSIHDVAEIAPNKLEGMSNGDLHKLVSLCERVKADPSMAAKPEFNEQFAYFESTGKGQKQADGSFPLSGLRLRFKPRLEAAKTEVLKGIRDAVDPKYHPTLDRLETRASEDGGATRLWDLKPERAFTNPTMRKQAAEWALSRNPETISDFVARMQFYEAEVNAQVRTRRAEATRQQQDQKAKKETELKRKLSQKELEALTKDITRSLGGVERPSINDKFDGDLLVKVMEEFAKPGESEGATAGTQAADAAWKRAEESLEHDQPGAKPIEGAAGLPDSALPGKVKQMAGSLHFSNLSEAAYHAHKHADELPSPPPPEHEMTVFLQNARDHISNFNLGENPEALVRQNQDGTKSVLMEDDKMLAIVHVNKNGDAAIATFMESAAARKAAKKKK